MTANLDLAHLETHDGSQLFCQFLPAMNPLGVLVTVHDYGQHSGAYTEAHRQFVRDSYTVYTMDLRGHGKSTGNRAAIENFDDYLDDLDLLIARVRDREPDAPLFLIGQGMGSLICLRYVTTRRASFHGLVLSGGLPLLPTNTKEKIMSQYASLLLSHVNANPEARELLLQSSLSGDLKNDELAFRGEVKAKTIAEINAANSLLGTGQEFLSFPVLCLASEDHPLLMEKLHDKLLTHDKTLIEYEGQSPHPLLGAERSKVSREIVKWCNEHLEKLSEEEEWGDPEDDSL